MRMFPLVLLVLFGACTKELPSAGTVEKVIPPPANASLPAVSGVEDNAAKVPEAFKGMDFANASYPTAELGRVRLKDGKHEHPYRSGGVTLALREVHYADLTGDGNPEAVVKLGQVVCGGSCDGGSALLYFFSTHSGRLQLLSRIETGSVAYTCGLRSFIFSKGTLVLEAFRNCSFNGVSLASAYDADSVGGKFFASEFTRFTMQFRRGRFVQTKRELIPNQESDVKNYPSRVSISDD